MVTLQEKAQCVKWFIEMRSAMQVQRNFRTRYGGIRHRRLVSQSSKRGLRRLEVVRNRKVLVEEAQVQQRLNECMNHFNNVPENTFDAHPENWDYQPPLYTGFCTKYLQILQELKPNKKKSNQRLQALTRTCFVWCLCSFVWCILLFVCVLVCYVINERNN